MEEQQKMWRQPWRYAESIAFVLGLMAAGFALQAVLGAFNFSAISSPVNLFIAGVIIVFPLVFSIWRKTLFYQWFSGVPFSVSLTGGLLVLGIVMGLTPQMEQLNPHDKSFITMAGFRQMTSSHAFVIIYFVTLLSLWTLIVRRLFTFRIKDYAFYLNHIGLWLLLFAAGLGAADLRRYVMYVNEGETQWQVYNKNDMPLELPIAIQLNDFQMEEYPPKLVIIDHRTGDALPENKPQYFQVDETNPSGKLLDWNIRVKKYIHHAVRSNDTNNLYREAHIAAAAPAVLIEASNIKTNKTLSGWVCGGNRSQPHAYQTLDNHRLLVVTQAEPKKFVSDIDVYTPDGLSVHALLEVNKPLKIGNWMIYQYGYDSQAGKASAYSSFELVYDPWKWLVYTGIVLLAAGAVCLILKKSKTV
jgi:hypothetical protein